MYGNNIGNGLTLFSSNTRNTSDANLVGSPCGKNCLYILMKPWKSQTVIMPRKHRRTHEWVETNVWENAHVLVVPMAINRHFSNTAWGIWQSFHGPSQFEVRKNVYLFKIKNQISFNPTMKKIKTILNARDNELNKFKIKNTGNPWKITGNRCCIILSIFTFFWPGPKKKFARL